MKKLVPDPPRISPEQKAIRSAAAHLENAIYAAASLPDPPTERYQPMLGDALLEMRMSRALLSVALAALPDSE